ncbi:MAG: hypothetical protein JST04_02955 [Bdellovibrionales bacterium]|nr:hypothetical protein [Bdellovibrionales bacterium]
MKLSMNALLFALVSLVAGGSALACSLDGKDGFLPRNNRYIPVRKVVLDRRGNPLGGGITEPEFNGVLDAVEKVYAPIVKQMGGNFVVHREWQDGTVNAYADRNDGNWNITMFGGLARHQETTIDAFLLVACHELGHHIGGAPIKRGRGWPANEGQADYWSTLKCARRVLLKTNNLRELRRLDVPAEVHEACASKFKNANEGALCERSSMAGKALARLLADLGGSKMPEFNTPDPSQVSSTDDNHPEAQCRLDTYYHGATCEVPFEKDVDFNDPTINTCAQEKGAKDSFRPRCWYAPKQDNRTHHARPNPHSRDAARNY